MKLKETTINGMLVLCFVPMMALYHKMKVLFTCDIPSLDGSEESNYSRAVMIGCLSVVLCCVIYIMILIHFNIKLMLFLLSKITGKNFHALNDIISRFIDLRIIHFVISNMHLKFLRYISQIEKSEDELNTYKDFAKKTNIIIKSIEHHRKLYENFILPI
ncbi:hypothetical protein DRF75_02490 [Ehrlichia minasensis]|uniref:Uncharacterized protein n=1 Tax=Ehrlichia minasensis TaxID=1242993 RepID=A0A4Q6I615_9RICK|nr:hypothetical protein [Ehrlichia minasensis]RZB12730.1 hypothetical protein DRF75_02490 [Ehrlichia minasensis]